MLLRCQVFIHFNIAYFYLFTRNIYNFTKLIVTWFHINAGLHMQLATLEWAFDTEIPAIQQVL